MAYNKNDINYQLAIEEAVKRNDYGAAAKLEQARNEKISGMSAEDAAKWGATATNNYSQYLGQSSTAGSAKDTVTYNDHQNNIKDLMNYNSYLWYGADDTTRDLLHAENQGLSTALNGIVSFDPTTGYWSNTVESSNSSAGSDWPTWDYSALGDKPTFNSKYEQNIDELLNQILNREDFEYNLLEDDLYRQYKEQYNREGDRSMNDTLAAAASGAGGMNSYAINAAQQANDYYAAQLTDKIPELYQLAYEMYLDDIDMQVRDLGLLTGMDDTQYGRYRDTMSDWYNDRDFSYNKYRDDVGDHKWQKEFDRDSSQWQQSFDYGVHRDNVADSQWQQSFDTSNSQWQQQFDASNSQWQQQFDRDGSRYNSQTAYEQAMDRLTIGVMPNSSLLSQAGISYSEAKAILDKVNATTSPSGSGNSSGGNGGGGGNTGDSYKRPAATPDPEPDPDPEPESAEVANPHGESWVHVQGYGRLSWQELEQLVNQGKITEKKTSYGLRYSKA